MIYYMVTGKNAGGRLVNAGQQITREEAIRLYTVANGWVLQGEDRPEADRGGQRGGQRRLDGGGQVGRRRGAERRLFQPEPGARRVDPEAAFRADGGGRQG